MRLWCLICLILFIESISRLIEERYDVTYHLEYDPNWNQSVRLSMCINLKIFIKENIKEIKLNELNETNINFKNFGKNQNFNTKQKIYKIIKTRDYFIYKELFCVIIDKRETNLFKDNKDDAIIFDKKDLEFLKLKDINSKFDKIIIYNSEQPYSNCKIKKLNRFKCINGCNRKNNKLPKYYYDGKENETIKLVYDKKDDQIRINETRCVNECKEQGIDCKLIYFRQKIDRYKGSNSTISKAYPLISEFDYWIQFIGLICLIFNISMAHLFIKMIKIIKKRIKINIRIIKIKKIRIKINLKKCLNYFGVLILSILFIYISFLIYKLIIDYLNKRDHPITKEITITELKLEPINLVICIPLIYLHNYDYQLKTLSELENDTHYLNLFDQNFKEIYLEYQNKKIRIDFKLNDKKIIFKNAKRCYQLEIYPKEFRYQNQLMITKLIVEFKYRFKDRNEYSFYLLTDDKKFYYSSYNIQNKYLFIKKEIKRSKLKKNNRCKDIYEKITDINDKCIKSEYIDKDRNIPFKLLVNKVKNSLYKLKIDKDQFTNNKWTKLSINYSINYDRNFVECLKTDIIHEQCFQIEYRDYLKKENIAGKKIEIELFYDVIKEIEQEPSVYKLLMNILNIQSITFGLNIFNLIIIIFDYDKIKFKYNKLLIYLLCLIGFIYHLYFIFNEIINGELIYSQHYELVEKFRIPNLVFCIKYKNLINPNHQLTYKYLDKITNEIDIDDFIYRIDYLNNSTEWINLSKKSLNNLNIDIFYFLEQKCFEVEFNVEYEFNQFHLNEDYRTKPIKLTFYSKFLNFEEIFYQLRIPNTMQVSKFRKLDLNKDVRVELMEIDYDDKFNLIKNPLSLIYGQNYLNDVDKYLNNLIDNFKINYNLATLNLPLNNSNDLLIEDQLFDQLYLQIQNSADFNQPSNLNFNRAFIIINEESDLKSFNLNFNFFRKIIKITNEDNYTKLTLNLLNLLSLWFNIGLFDLHTYLDLIVIKIKYIFIFLYKLLIKIKSKLFIKLNLFYNHNVNSRPKLRVSRFLKSYA